MMIMMKLAIYLVFTLHYQLYKVKLSGRTGFLIVRKWNLREGK